MNNSPTVLEIDSKAIHHNINFFRSKLKPGTKFLVVIKAFAYGSDSVEVAKILEKETVDYLAVAYTQEGMDLRKAGIKLPILVLHPQTDNFENIIKYDLEPNLYGFYALEEFIELANQKGLNDYPVHIKINSGMNRLGFKERDIERLSLILKDMKSVKIQSFYSHLAASEDYEEREFTLGQISVFNKMCNELSKNLSYQPLKHTANTSGIINYPEAHFDLVRLGIGFYGFGNDPKHTPKLKNVCNLKTKISQIQYLEKGGTVSYNRKFKAEKPTRVAVIPLGYADGLNRLLSNGKGFVTINNQKVPIAGTVCMDIFMVDVTDIDCEEGDEVIIFNHQDHILDFAEATGTIPYEILTSISQRVRREVV
ncbi:MAG: alanine racemase [Bacteroidota bacterium]